MIFRDSVPEKKKTILDPNQKNRDFRHMLCNIAKDPFYGVAFFGRMAYCCNIYYLQNTSIWSSPPPLLQTLIVNIHIYSEWPWSIIAVHAALRHNSKSMQKKKMSETLKTIPLQMFSCLSLKHELHIHYLS